ncbi:MAG: protein-arginine deiminase domain-containing protein, partial [Candidatus Riflebacteria bacterium]|nr:protein-arginine deiminase domain-containing protein [Candidatus Riflebacteria bacterium]
PGILASFWNSYLVKNPSNQFSGGDYGGNIEVTPDNILLIGNTSTQELRDYLEKHGYRNRMAVLETDWLIVGHVDEYISVCPNPKAARGYTLIKANPRLALRMIKDSSEAELNKVPHKEYRKALLRVRHYLHRAEIDRANATKAVRSNISGAEKGFAETVLDYIEKPDGVDDTLPAMLSGATLSSDHELPMSQVEEFIKLNLTISNVIDTNVKAACRKISQVSKSAKAHSILSFPALYRKVSGDKHIAYLPGSVNQLILNDQLIVPDPKVIVMRRYIQQMAEKIGLHANFIDSLPYHNLEGQLHCGSNVFRHPNKYFVKPR